MPSQNVVNAHLPEESEKQHVHRCFESIHLQATSNLEPIRIGTGGNWEVILDLRIVLCVDVAHGGKAVREDRKVNIGERTDELSVELMAY